MPSERLQRRIDHLLDEAEQAIEQEQWERALEMAKLVFSVDPDNADARSFVKLAEVGLGKAGRSTQSPDTAVSSTDAATLNSLPRGDLSPASFANGRYTVKKKLGEGGKKRVYLAHDTVLDRDVAFALIKTEGLDDAARQRITREAQAMGRLGDHPNIMPIFDLGVEPSPSQGEGTAQPYMVLPIMTGGDVEGLIKKASDHRLPLDRLLAITRDVCSGLSFAHSRGIVHRDLKPGNVWLTTEGTARIGDFGLAIATDRSRLTREGMMVGTVSYMPPEQAMGGEITPRADLYSLGAMLYEMVTGRPPYLGDDDIAIIGQHINTPPVAPTWHRPDCPKTLDSLIMRLLAKDPKQRPESARDVLSALEAVETVTMPAKAGIQSAAQRPDRSAPSGRLDPSLRRDGDTRKADGESSVGAASADSPRSLDSMSSGVFVGRQKEMDQLRAALEEVLSGHGRLITLVGEPGIGKTRTAQELATYAGLRRCQVLWGRCYEGGGAPPYWPWVQAIRSYVRERDPQELKREMGSTASVIAEVVADIKERLPGIEPPPQLESPESARFRLFDSITAFLKTASSTQPLVIVLDDLHWSDKPSLLLLEFVARELSNSRLLIVGTYRDVEVNRKHPLSQTLGELSKERLFEKVLLRGIQKEDVARFIELAAGMKPPSGLVDAIHTQTAGNPLFVTEVVRWLIQEGSLTPEKVKNRSSWSMPIPEGIRDVIGKRLDRLSERCNDVLTTAAVIGRRFALPALAKLYSDPKLPLEERLSEERLLELMEEALAARVIEELSTGPGRYQFTHALMQETLTSELSTTRKVRLHARIALALEEIYGERANERAPELAEHFSEAESLLGPSKLVKYSLLAGEAALAGHAHDEAVRLFQRAVTAKATERDDSDKAAALFGLGRAQYGSLARYEVQQAVETLTKAFDIYLALGDRESAVKVAVTPMASVGGITTASELLGRALEVVRPGTADHAILLNEYAGHKAIESGDTPALREMAEQADRIARNLGDLRLEVRLLSGSWAHGDVREHTARTSARLLELATILNDKVAEFRATWNSLFDLVVDGDREGVQKLTTRLVAQGNETRDPTQQLSARIGAASLAMRTGDWVAASRICDESLEANNSHTHIWGSRTISELHTGNFSTADRFIQKMIETQKSAPPGPSHFHLVPGVIIPLSAYMAGDSSRLELAKSMCKQATVSTSHRAYLGHLGLGLVAIQQSDSAAARSAYEQLSHSGPYLFVTTFIDRQRALGLIAMAAGLQEQGLEHLRTSISFTRKAGFRPDFAWACFELSELLASSPAGGSAEEWRTLREESLAVARELGMKPLIERILKRRQFLKA